MKKCRIENCDSAHEARGFCRKHYYVANRNGELARLGIAVEVCIIDGCNKVHEGLGFCSSHYTRFKLHGNPFAGNAARGEIAEWILRHLKYEGDGCLIFPFPRNRDGYCNIAIDKKCVSGHKLICTITHGPCHTEKPVVRHLCGNGKKGCLNPKHMVWGTHAENMQDMIDHDQSPKGERHPMHKLTETEVLQIVKDDRPHKEIAEEYLIDKSNVSVIKLGKSWNWLTGIKKKA